MPINEEKAFYKFQYPFMILKTSHKMEQRGIYQLVPWPVMKLLLTSQYDEIKLNASSHSFSLSREQYENIYILATLFCGQNFRG